MNTELDAGAVPAASTKRRLETLGIENKFLGQGGEIQVFLMEIKMEQILIGGCDEEPSSTRGK